MGGKSSTTTQKTELPPEIVAAYNNLIAQATPVSQTPYQPYTGGVNGSGFEQNQITGFNNIANLAGSSNGAFNSASGALASTATPTSASVGQYMSPYISNVVNATMANMNEQNAEQQQGVLGNAAAQGALGGNRVGVAQAELARQQNLANQQTIAGLYNQGYNTALGAAQSDKAAQLQAAQGYTNLGQTAMQTNLAQAAAQVGAGTQQQQWNYQQYQNARSYPFETTSWLANIVEGLGAGRGTTTTTQPSGNTGSAVLGGILGLASLFNRGGVVGGEDRPHRAQGGIIPYTGPSGIAANNNNPMGANDNFGTSYVPQVASGGASPGQAALPHAQSAQPPDQGQQMLQQGIKAAEDNLKQKYPNGIIAGMSQPAPAATAAPTPTPNADPGLLSKIGGFLGFAEGGVIRGYDSGGYVDPRVVTVPVAPDVNTVDPATISPAVMKAILDQPAPVAPQNAAPVPADVAAANKAGGVYTPAPPLPAPQTVSDLPVAGVVPQQNAQAPQKSNGVAPQQYNSGNAREMMPVFDKINSSYGLPDGYLNRTAYIESSFNPSANNGVSRGEFQFTPGTQAQYGLKNPYDPQQSADAAARLAVDNAKYLQNGLGRAPTGAELYLAHQQGAGGALNLLTHPDSPATDIVGKQAVVQNGGNTGMTAGQFANLWLNKFNGASGGSGASGNGNPSTTSSSAGVAPVNTSANVTSSGSSFSNQNPQPGVLSHLFGLGGNGLGLSNDQKMALLSAGLGMMAGTSPNFATNVGSGGLKGVEQWMSSQKLNRENALAQSEISTRSGQLGLEGKRVDLAGQELALQAQRAASEIGLQTAQTAKTNLETTTGRYQQTVTPAGIIVRDMTDPNSPPKLTTWDDIQRNGPPIVSNEAVGANVGSGAANPSVGTTTSQGAPKAQGNNVPVTAAPTTPVGAPAQAQPVFQSSAPARIPVDGRNFSPTGQQIVANETTDALKEARGEYQGAQSAQTQLAEMKHDLATIPNSAWTTPGTGFQSRVQWAKSINTAFQGLGVEPPIDERAVAAGEDLNKLTTRLGFDLSKTLGSREAASVVDQAVSAVPGGYNSPEGARRVIAGIEAANQRKMDYYNFLQDWSAKTGGSIKGADDYFNRVNPPELYALSSYVPPEAMGYLRQHPEFANDFDAKYGMGHPVSQYVLAGAK